MSSCAWKKQAQWLCMVLGALAWLMGARITSAGEWRTEGGSAQRTGVSTACAGPDEDHLAWSETVGSGLYVSVALGSDGTLYAGTSDGQLQAYGYDLNGITPLWSYTVPSDNAGGYIVQGAPSVTETGEVLFGCGYTCYSVDVASGALNWSLETGGVVHGAPLAHANGNVFFGSSDGYFTIRFPDGSYRRQYMSLTKAAPAFSPGGDRVYITGCDPTRFEGYLYCFETTAGSFVWKTSLGGPSYATPVVDSAGDIYVGSDSQRLYKIGSDGSVLYSYYSPGRIREAVALEAAEERLAMVCDDGKVRSLDISSPSTASLVWSYGDGDGAAGAAPPVIGNSGNVYVGTVAGTGSAKILALDRNGVLLWSRSTTGSIQSGGALVSDNTLFVGDLSGTLYAQTDNLPPSASFTMNGDMVATAGVAPLSVVFDASASSDPEGGPLTYSWDFGDGTPAGSGVSPSHEYSGIGQVYTATLTVTDEAGDTATASGTISVGLAPPIADAPVGDIFDGTPELSWTAPYPVAGLTYDVEVYAAGTDPADPANLFYTGYGLISTSVAVAPELTVNASYTWRVRAEDTAAGTVSTWDAQDFTFLGPPDSAPTLLSPSGLVSDLTPLFSWTAVNGATKYDLVVQDRTDGVVQVIRIDTLTGTSYTPTSDLFGSRFRTYVRAGNGYGWGPWSDYLEFEMDSALMVPEVLAPLGTISELRPTFTWTAVATASEYELYVQDRTEGVVTEFRTTVSGATSYTPTTDLFGTNFGIYVRAGNGSRWGEWSALALFDIDAALTVPTVTAPLGMISNLRPTFSWTAVSNASEYELYVQDRTGGTVTTEFTTIVSGATSYTPPGDLFGTQFGIYVRAGKDGSFGGWSALALFDVDVALSVPTVTAPLGTIADPRPTFTWTAVSNATQYELVVQDRTTTVVELFRVVVGGATDYTHSSDLFGTNFGVYVRAGDGNSWGGWSTLALFDLDTSLSVPTVTAPTGTITDLTPTFTWTAVPNATDYELLVQDRSNGSVTEFATIVSGTTSYTPISDIFGTSFAVYVRAGQGGSWGDWSAEVPFALDDSVSKTTITGPTGTIVDPSPTITWTAVPNAIEYDVYVQDRSDGTVSEIRTVVSGATSFTPAVDLFGTNFRIYIRASDGNGYGWWCTPVDFVLDRSVSVPALTAPIGSIADPRPTFTWTGVTNATEYDLWVRDITGGGDETEIRTTVTGATDYTPGADLVGTDFKVYVRAGDGNGWTAWSDVEYFSLP